MSPSRISGTSPAGFEHRASGHTKWCVPLARLASASKRRIMEKRGRANMDRAVTPKEADIVRWLLDRAPAGDVTAYLLQPVERLRVAGGCDCGCSSLNFQPDLRGAGIIADAVAVFSDGQEAGLILWGRRGEVVALEVDDLHPGASRRALEISNLRTFEERGREPL